MKEIPSLVSGYANEEFELALDKLMSKFGKTRMDVIDVLNRKAVHAAAAVPSPVHPPVSCVPGAGSAAGSAAVTSSAFPPPPTVPNGPSSSTNGLTPYPAPQYTTLGPPAPGRWPGKPEEPNWALHGPTNGLSAPWAGADEPSTADFLAAASASSTSQANDMVMSAGFKYA